MKKLLFKGNTDEHCNSGYQLLFYDDFTYEVEYKFQHVRYEWILISGLVCWSWEKPMPNSIQKAYQEYIRRLIEE